jgi:hypothetical protein
MWKRQGFESNVFLFQGVCYAPARMAERAIGGPGAHLFLFHRFGPRGERANFQDFQGALDEVTALA